MALSLSFDIGFGVRLQLFATFMLSAKEVADRLTFFGDEVTKVDLWGRREEALHLVWRLMADPLPCMQLRSFAADAGIGYASHDLSECDDRAVAQIVAHALSRGEVTIYRVKQRPYSPPRIVEPPPSPGPSYAPPSKYFELQLVFDHDGSGVRQVPLQVVGSDGEAHKATTNAEGRIRLNGVEPGAYEVSASSEGAQVGTSVTACGWDRPEKPREASQDEKRAASAVKHLVAVEEHRVRTGERLDSIAQSAGMTWQGLALFNWGTTDPDEINEHLASKVGCTKKTKDGRNYLFSNRDRPGIVLIPRPWRAPGLETRKSHVLRVKVLRHPPRFVFFSS